MDRPKTPSSGNTGEGVFASENVDANRRTRNLLPRLERACEDMVKLRAKLNPVEGDSNIERRYHDVCRSIAKDNSVSYPNETIYNVAEVYWHHRQMVKDSGGDPGPDVLDELKLTHLKSHFERRGKDAGGSSRTPVPSGRG